jgi:prevent-host-death family protein
MRQISTYDAKNRLSELLDAVASGETIEIVRRGKPAARLVPITTENAQFTSPAEAARLLRENRARVPRNSIRASIDEGRRRANVW